MRIAGKANGPGHQQRWRPSPYRGEGPARRPRHPRLLAGGVRIQGRRPMARRTRAIPLAPCGCRPRAALLRTGRRAPWAQSCVGREGSESMRASVSTIPKNPPGSISSGTIALGGGSGWFNAPAGCASGGSRGFGGGCGGCFMAVSFRRPVDIGSWMSPGSGATAGGPPDEISAGHPNKPSPSPYAPARTMWSENGERFGPEYFASRPAMLCKAEAAADRLPGRGRGRR